MDKRFVEILENLNSNKNECLEKWNKIEKAYSKKNRYYHNLIHLEIMFESYDLHRINIENPIEVALAIYYHDVIYDAKSKNNELKSAEFALKELKNIKGLNFQIIYDLIISTQHHKALNNDEKWMVDFDLQILGFDWEIYKNYANQIRKEYAIYPDFLYNPGRKKALQHFLNQTEIFKTEIFKNKYESQARENLKREIDLL